MIRQMARYLNLRQLWKDERGALAAIVGLAIIPLFAAIGLAVDGSRGYMLKSKLSYAIDAAGLAGGRAFDTDMREDDIMMFFEANFPPGYMNAVLAPNNPVITFDDEENTVTIVASATIPTRFMSVAGVHEMTVSARTVVKRELQGLELALVMDNTGSMRSGGKITAMKDAATDLVDILYGDRDEVENFWVSVVPYAATVNMGTDHSDWLVTQSFDPDAAWLSADPDSSERFGYHEDHYLPTTWKGCVEARSYPNDSNDALSSVEAWYPHLWRTTLRAYENPDWPHDPDERVVVVRDGDGDPDDPSNVVYEQGDPAETPEVVEYDEYGPWTWGRWLNGDNEWDPDGPQSALLEEDTDENDGTGPNLGCPPAITPLVASKATVQAAIDEMRPWHRGGTMANLGLAWGWRTLSPQWRGIWGGDSPPELPLDYTTPSMTKVVILLTDGVNEWYDWPGAKWSMDGQDRYSGIPGSNQYDSNTSTDYEDDYWPGADYTAYGRLNEARLGTANNGTARSVINNRMLELCEAMKLQDVVLYTITFQLSNSTTQQLFRDCATDDDHYFNSPTNSDLQQTFVTIADELSKLRIAE